MNKPLTILYFAWLRERIGSGQEELSVPDEVDTVAGLVDYLVALGPGYANAFKNRRTVRCAVNQEFAPVTRSRSFRLSPGVRHSGVYDDSTIR
jgi:molybdopterin synthase sulfur carrier subunit